MDFYVHLARPGGRVSKRRNKAKSIGHQHKLTALDGMNWFKTKYDGVIMQYAR